MSQDTLVDIKNMHFEPLPDGRVTTEGAAKYCGLAPRTLEMMRCQGRGPRYTKIGRVFYFQQDLDLWIEAGRVEPTDSGRP